MLSQGLFPFLMESAQIAQDLLEFSHFVGRKRPKRDQVPLSLLESGTWSLPNPC